MTILGLHSKARRTLKVLATAVAGNVELAYSSPAFRGLKRHLLWDGRGLASGMGAHGTLLNMLCAINLAAQRARAADRLEVTDVMQKQRQNLLDVGILVAVGASCRRFEKGDLLYQRLVEAGVRGANLDPVCLLYTIYNFDIIIGMIKLYQILADCSYGRIRNFCGILGDFNRLSPEDNRAGVRLVGAAIRLEKRTLDQQLLEVFEGMRRDPSLCRSFALVVDLGHITVKPGFEGMVFVIKCEDLSWSDLTPLYAQLRTLLEQLGDLDLLSLAEANVVICQIVTQWASTGSALMRNFPLAFLLPGHDAVACKHVLNEPRVSRALTKLGVLQPPTDKLILEPAVLEKAAKAAMQRATDREQWAHDRLRRAELNAARRVAHSRAPRDAMPALPALPVPPALPVLPVLPAAPVHVLPALPVRPALPVLPVLPAAPVPVLPVLQHGQRAVWALPPLASCAS